jgi:hypothetical protein
MGSAVMLLLGGMALFLVIVASVFAFFTWVVESVRRLLP